MRRFRRILLVLGVAGGPAFVASIGCNVDNSRYPGLSSELPNLPGIPNTLVIVDAGGDGMTAASDAGPAQTVCDTAASFTSGNQACQQCENANCASEYTQCAINGCNSGTATCCSAAAQCVSACAAGDGTCLAACIGQYSYYATLAQCLLTSCQNACGVATPATTCPVTISDAGTD